MRYRALKAASLSAGLILGFIILVGFSNSTAAWIIESVKNNPYEAGLVFTAIFTVGLFVVLSIWAWGYINKGEKQ